MFWSKPYSSYWTGWQAIMCPCRMYYLVYIVRWCCVLRVCCYTVSPQCEYDTFYGQTGSGKDGQSCTVMLAFMGLLFVSPDFSWGSASFDIFMTRQGIAMA